MATKYVVTAVLVSTCFQIASAIYCYDCSSANNSMCLEPTSYDDETLQKYLRLADCNQGVLNAGTQKFFCRKIVQTILHKNHDAEVRVMRGCGWVPYKKDCYKADNEDHLETVCQCFSDGCNSASSLTMWVLTPFIALGVIRLSKC